MRNTHTHTQTPKLIYTSVYNKVRAHVAELPRYERMCTRARLRINKRVVRRPPVDRGATLSIRRRCRCAPACARVRVYYCECERLLVERPAQ